MKEAEIVIAAILLAAAMLVVSPMQTGSPRPDGSRYANFQQQTASAQAPTTNAPPRPASPVDEIPVVTKHEIKVGGKTLKYTATAGMMPIKNQSGETEAHIFFMAYTLDETSHRAPRPLMFSFNGGPGSASVWLHLGALGPKRVKMLNDGMMPPPPYQLVENEQTWLDQTDLVFIDPVGTGYSRAARPELGAKFWSLNGDLDSVGEFIRMYLTRYERWSSPLFIVGESYGTTRASGLSAMLLNRGIACNGILLISTVMNFQTLLFAPGNDLAYLLIAPSYTATAWYHKKLPPDLQRQDLKKVLEEAEQWVATEYTVALGKGDRLTSAERQVVAEKFSRYTGLDKRYIEQCDLRVDLPHFQKELLRDQKRSVGRLDSRFKGIDELPVSETPDSDQSMNAIIPPYTATFNHYVRDELGFKSDLTYYILGGGIGRWDFGANNSYADTSELLRSAFARNPYMEVFVAEGYYDMATPYFAAEYTLNHMRLDPSVRGNVTIKRYEAGHMMYIDTKSLAQLKQDVAAFIQHATTHELK
jgi:carboxypeptidase C (cathepsin A)